MKVQGIDTVEFGIEVPNYNEDFKQFILELEIEKEKAQEKFGEHNLLVGFINMKVKGKGQGLYGYKLECDDFHICFMKRQIENTSPIFVRFISSFLWKYGYKEAINVFMEWFNQTFHIEVKDTKISRIDFCLDTDEIQFAEKDMDNFFTRARKKEKNFPLENECVDNLNYSGRIFTGFVIGKGSPLSCRIYNKTIEIKKSSKGWFKQIWIENGWTENRTVWRIEFQIRRKVLKEMEVYNILEVEEKSKNIWAYLTQKWLTLRKKNKGKNISRFQLDERWEKVQKGSKDYKSSPGIRKAVKYGNLHRLLDQCCGLFLSISAIKKKDKMRDTYIEIMEYMNEKNRKNNTTFEKEVEKRKYRFIDKTN